MYKIDNLSIQCGVVNCADCPLMHGYVLTEGTLCVAAGTSEEERNSNQTNFGHDLFIPCNAKVKPEEESIKLN